MLRAVSILCYVVATVALLFCCDTVFWHVLPLGFEGTLTYGGFAWMLGSAASLLSVVFAIIGLCKHGMTRLRLAFCIWSTILVLAFAVLMLGSV